MNLLGWLIPLGYMGGAFGTWIGGAVRIGARLEEISANGRASHKARWHYDEPNAANTAVFFRFLLALATGLLWPIAVPAFLAFNKGKGLGLKKKQMKLLLDEAEAEIVRIKKKEGWS